MSSQESKDNALFDLSAVRGEARPNSVQKVQDWFCPVEDLQTAAINILILIDHMNTSCESGHL